MDKSELLKAAECLLKFMDENPYGYSFELWVKEDNAHLRMDYGYVYEGLEEIVKYAKGEGDG